MILIGILVTGIIAAVLVSVYWKAYVLDLAEKELRSAFKEYSVKISSREVTARSLIFRGIEVAKRGQEVLKTGEFRADFTIVPLITKRAARFSIKDIVIYEKLKIPEAHGSFVYSKGVIAFGSLSARVLDGTVAGGALIKLGKVPYYAAALTLNGLKLEKIIEILDLGEKLDLSGLVDGSIELSGNGGALTRLKGRLKTASEGGILTIKDQEWLNAIAVYAKADIKIIEENFKNYSYNEGNANLGLKGTSVVLEAHLNGPAGKRDLVISLHDFNK
ncbi:MAG: YdbH domain-containing protein [Candidatus Omnitrophota bacterium]